MSKARDIANILSANTSIATDAEVSSAVSTHATAANGHIGRGTTLNRPESPSVGDFYFDTTSSSLMVYKSTGWEKSSQDPAPQIASISPTTAGTTGTTITITGSNFKSGLAVQFIGADTTSYNSPIATFVGATTVTATTPVLSVANEPYDIKVINNDNQVGILENALDAGGSPIWNTASGTIATITEQSVLNISVSATDPDGTSIVYSSSNLPSWVSLNSSTGALTGTAPDVASNTTYTFNVTASDGVNTSVRSFSIVSNIFTVPLQPTVGTVTLSGSTATVPFTAPSSNGGQTITSYIATSSPGSLTGTITQSGSGSITVSGLSIGTSYTFTVVAVNSVGSSTASNTSNSVTPQYSGETQSGGSGYSNTGVGPFTYANRADSSLTRDSASSNFNGSNQGSYFGGLQSVQLGGTGCWAIPLNNGNTVPAGTYNFTATVYLDLNNQNTSHDGGYFWLVTPTKKYFLGQKTVPSDARDTQLTLTANNIVVTAGETMKFESNYYDGSSAWAMGGRNYGFTITKVA
jgi:hypothetical protein